MFIIRLRLEKWLVPLKNGIYSTRFTLKKTITTCNEQNLSDKILITYWFKNLSLKIKQSYLHIWGLILAQSLQVETQTFANK